jgi:basic membrane protein A and related proteins
VTRGVAAVHQQYLGGRDAEEQLSRDVAGPRPLGHRHPIERNVVLIHSSARRVAGVAAACITALALAACASNGASAPPAAASGPSGTASPGAGTVPAGEPDVNGDGKVVIGVLSPGDLNDHGYYQSFVDEAAGFTASKGWTLIKRGNVNPADALNAARALCAQKVDLVALGASELKDAIPASEEPACAKTAWYVPSGENVSVTPKISVSTDKINEDLLAAGYATGLLMQAKGATKAGFVTGSEADFTRKAATAYKAGIRMVIPSATLVTTYTGDFNDTAKAKEATQAQISQGVAAIYPYLGGATDASAQLAKASNIIISTPGTDRCADPTVKFDVSVIFSPGAYFSAALKDFAAGKLAMGAERVWRMGVDPYPTVKLCNGTADQNQKVATFISNVGSKKIDPDAEVQRLGS